MKFAFRSLILFALWVAFTDTTAQAGDCFAGDGFDRVRNPFFTARVDPFFSLRRVDPFFGIRRDPFFGVGFSRGFGVGRGPVVIQERRGLFGLRRTTTVIGR